MAVDQYGERGIADSDIDAEEAWSLATGGVTQLGDTIVVAVIDVGVDYTHEDLAQNIWKNNYEIADNGIDDDQNGYVDDVRGWNVLETNDNIEAELFGGGVPDEHGTEILGVIGAVGNNDIGITGINWNVKLMNVFFNSDLNEADMIAAYGYILQQRKIYNETGGARGAYVVATNLSYGDEDLSPEETPIWCAIYDSLGNQGILNCTATANTSINIDSIQDVPTSCASDYMIAVTATNQSDVRSFAAYGKHDIDIAAPGSQVFTTSIPGYDFVSGTSFASPIVAGAIGLLYSSPCGDLAALAKIDPAAAALQARSLILDQSDKIPSLAEEISSGGRLNIFNALNKTLAACQSCIAPFGLEAEVSSNDPTSVEIAWQQADSVSSVQFSWRALGDTVWINMDSVSSPILLTALEICSTYEYQLEATCLDGTSATSPTIGFMTGGCCQPVTNISAQALSDTVIDISWQGATTDVGYVLIYGEVSDSVQWDTAVVTQGVNSTTIGDLSSCTTYLLFIQSICIGSGTASSDTLMIRTLGCGACLDSTYCELSVNAVGDEWIESVKLNTINLSSGYDNGYGDYTGNATQLKQGNAYKLRVIPGFATDTMAEHYFAWIDFNQNGNFDDEDEQVYASDTAISTMLEATIRIPDNAPVGPTRFRVMMLFDPIDDMVSGCATTIDLGEAEDYCVEIIIDSLLCPLPTGLDTMNYQGTSTMVVWEEVDSAIAYVIRHRKVGDDEWMEVVDTTNMFELSELEDCEVYEVQVQAVCGRDTSGYGDTLRIVAFCSTRADEIALNFETRIFPNPFEHRLSVEINSETNQMVEVKLLQLNRQEVLSQRHQVISGKQVVELNQVASLPAGMYLLSLQNKDGRLIRKVLRQ
ncbi:MAG: S8 family serine peptidase [Saprospiraceae bacterium]|nr:S8 family serine peptidase [Saprospiraceae bacterium]